GYRTPFYNRAIGNVPNSRHVFGGAADIFLDRAPRDGQMDDINFDGIEDFRDAQRLYQIAHELFSPWSIDG
ncbi:MAG TPA: D-Ala-D-Ala carboxypeptidase family metallohydrolase, partial [Gammaproteobacteria bacterium]